MRRTGLRLATAGVLLALGVTAGPAIAGAAEDEAAAQPAELVRLTVRPGQEATMERFLARLAEAARRTGAPVRWRAHRRIDGERPSYVLVMRAADAEQLDAWGSATASEALERAYGAEEARRILALREQALESVQRERFVAAPALSFDE